MAVAIMGGLVVATGLTLLALPAMYARGSGSGARCRARQAEAPALQCQLASRGGVSWR